MSAVTHLPSRIAQCDRCGAACVHCTVRVITEAAAYPPRTVEADPVPDYLTVGQVAERLAVSTRTVERFIESGDIATVRIGRSVRIPADAYRAYTESLT